MCAVCAAYWLPEFLTLVLPQSHTHHPLHAPRTFSRSYTVCLVVSGLDFFFRLRLLFFSTRHLQNHNGVAQAAKHLIVVAGHSVTVSGHLEDAGIDEKDWFLLSYQQHHGLPQAVLAHIRSGIQLAQDDPSALLIFSGGATRAQTGPDTEGASYYRVADAMDLWNNKKNGGASASSSSNTSTVRARTLSEDYATDSFQNLCVVFPLT